MGVHEPYGGPLLSVMGNTSMGVTGKIWFDYKMGDRTLHERRELRDHLLLGVRKWQIGMTG